MGPVRIYYFSGTGNTRLVLRFLESELRTREVPVSLHRMEDLLNGQEPLSLAKGELLGVSYPIHGFGPPSIVFDFLRALPVNPDGSAFILMTAADMYSWNKAGGTRVQRRLRGKGYRIHSEILVPMPANMVVHYPDRLAKQLCNKAQEGMRRVADQLALGGPFLYHENRLVRLLATTLNMFEHSGTGFFGKDLRVSSACTMCRKCVEECPVRNIRVAKGRIRFGWKCMACFRCIYGCPVQAIRPLVEGFTVLKGGYDIERIHADPAIPGDFVTPETRGSYRRLRDYLFGE